MNPLALLACLSAFGPGASEPPFDEALALGGLTTETARLDAEAMKLMGQDEFVPAAFEVYHQNPFRIPTYTRSLRGALTAPAVAPSDLIATGGRYLSEGTRRTLIGNPLEKVEAAATKPGALASSLRAVYAAAGKRFPSGLERGVRKAEEALPKCVSQAAALVILQTVDSAKWRERALAGCPKLSACWDSLTKEYGDETAALLETLPIMHGFDQKLMLAGGFDLTLAAERACASLEKAKPGGAFRYRFETPWGAVALNGDEDDSYGDEPYLLIIDVGGNDTYYGGGATLSTAQPGSTLIDLKGNDRYVSAEPLLRTPLEKWDGRKKRDPRPSFGGAMLGYATLIDCAGDDLYRTTRPGLGSARYGSAALWDKGGADRYDSYADSEGHAEFGVGVLMDSQGDDEYLAFTGSQGEAGTKGFGLLLDQAGNDRYVANDTVIDFPSSQSAQHNGSNSQGAAFGRRGDYIDGHSLGGGFGVLCDVAGDDAYTCGVMGQGFGYWEAVGALFDLGGNDTYSGAWYVQGTAAHFAVGILEDLSGNDKYASTINMSLGAGHDYSVGLFQDLGGDDDYRANTLSIGASNANGIGIFWDASGNDRYAAPSVTLGWATDPGAGGMREFSLGLGLFMDGGGQDSFPASVAHAVSGAKTVNWTRMNAKPRDSQLGIFWHR